MENISYEIHGERSFRFPAKPLVLAPSMGDLQYGASGFQQKLLEDYIQRSLTFEHVHYIGGGDYVDRYSPSNRREITRLRERTYDSGRAKIDTEPYHDLEAVKDILSPTRGACDVCGLPKWLAILEGHHFHIFEDGATTDVKLAEWLGAPLLGRCGVIHLDFMDDNKHKGLFRIWAAHPDGGGSTRTAILRKLEHAATDFVADLYLMYHYHQLFSEPYPRIDWLDTGRAHRQINRPYRLTAPGAYLAGYVEGLREYGRPQSTYVEQKALRPQALGGLFIHITPYMPNSHIMFKQEAQI